MGKCKKCGNTIIETQYDNAFDTLNKKCTACGYCWSEKPLNSN